VIARVGIAVTLAANVAHGLDHGLAGRVVAAWSTVARVGSYEFPMLIIRNAKASTNSAIGATPGS
jgi:hypothetical protein